MSDYVLKGTQNLVRYMNTLGIDTAAAQQRAASAVGIPYINFRTGGVPASSFTSKKYSEAKAQALANILGVTVANVTTNGGQVVVG